MRRNLHLGIVVLVLLFASCGQPVASPIADLEERIRRVEKAMLTIAAVLALTFLYRGPLGGFLVHPLMPGETVLTKALLGIFFSTPIILLVLTVLVWRNRYWSTPERVQYTLVVLGALVGVYLLRDLWGLMFWG